MKILEDKIKDPMGLLKISHLQAILDLNYKIKE